MVGGLPENPEKWHRVMQNLFGDQSEKQEEEVDSEHESNPHPNSSSKSKLIIVKFKTPESVDGWEVRQGTYFQDVVASKYDGGMDAKFVFTFTGDAVFSVFARRGY
ncbi:hypothetical protein D8674_030192 [Pyrus ussuriensis x Pyrus communis]|uniref:Uncharacterized protein n=1 Tax=Pyrus ussuriensis x Pyrus communis TaxID=2448454 RepID=A0A5N5F0D4_9ROSA|nr:hypothetical protein D8674_030192 [Pyrus ussuriensis x Pyrus communis]